MEEQHVIERSERDLALPKILLVDDEGDILRSLRRLLRKKFDITTTVEPEEALRFLTENEYAILLSDQRMPVMQGTELMAKARLASPDTVRIILTGYSDINAAMEAINKAGVYRFLQKPWNDADLISTLCQAAEHYALVKENARLQALTRAQNEKLKEFNTSLKTKVFERTRQVTQLNEELSSTFQGALQVLAKLGEMHSPVLSNHARRVTTLSKEVGRCMGMSEKQLFQLEIAATLHDIGKIGMEPALLRRHQAVLSPNETAVLLTHATTGAALMKLIPNLEEAALYVRHHHEQYEGKGFPDKLFGRNIPLGARIIAAVDAYDNALNNRTTFGTTTPEKARQYVKERSPREFDPDVVAILMVLLEESEVDQEPEAIEVEVDVRDLQTGMVLSRDMLNDQGLLILPKDTRLDETHLYQLLKHHQINPIIRGFFVYRTAPSTS
ncbi:MAG: HD domain-containing phosphohydrolase [Rhodothermales bacterium]